MTTYLPWRWATVARIRISDTDRRTHGLLGTLRAVLGTSLLTIFDALQVQGAADDVVANTRQVLDTTTADQNDRVFLQVVAFAADVGDDFEAVGQTHFGDFTQSGVRLLGGRGVDTCANTTALWAVLERRALAACATDFARLAHELANGWHDLYVSYNVFYVLVDVLFLENAFQRQDWQPCYRSGFAQYRSP